VLKLFAIPPKVQDKLPTATQASVTMIAQTEHFHVHMETEFSNVICLE